MQQPAAWARVHDDDPLAAARAHGVLAEKRLLESEGGVLGADEVASALHISRQAVDKRRRNRKLLGVRRGATRWVYPAWQLAKGHTVPGLPDVLHALRDHDPLSQVTFFLAPEGFLGDRTPLEVLRAGDLVRVLKAAERYREQGLD